VTVVRDDRGPGWTLFRRNDHPHVDFSQVDAAPGVIFAHRNGFIVKVETDTDLDKITRAAIHDIRSTDTMAEFARFRPVWTRCHPRVTQEAHPERPSC
jgi:hypothetical protein